MPVRAASIDLTAKRVKSGRNRSKNEHEKKLGVYGQWRSLRRGTAEIRNGNTCTGSTVVILRRFPPQRGAGRPFQEPFTCQQPILWFSKFGANAPLERRTHSWPSTGSASSPDFAPASSPPRRMRFEPAAGHRSHRMRIKMRIKGVVHFRWQTTTNGSASLERVGLTRSVSVITVSHRVALRARG
jgi:hypothetical protein